MIKALIIDDSAVMRAALKAILERSDNIEVVGVAADPVFARDMILTKNPDVITLDIEMPRMDGLTFLKRLMGYRPLPVVMISSSTERGARATIEALRLGAVDIVAKPNGDEPYGMRGLEQEIIRKVTTAAATDVKSLRQSSPVEERRQEVSPPPTQPGQQSSCRSVICIGASTGGTIALEYIITRLPKTTPGVLVVQHMPRGFTKAFAERINTVSQMQVLEALPGISLHPGRVIIARGGDHLLLHRGPTGLYVTLGGSPPVNRHRPSVDVLFESVASVAAKNALGVLLTGMGADGAKGMLKLQASGATTIAQDESTSAVFGMPHAAIELGAASRVLPLQEIPQFVLSHGKQFLYRAS